MDEAAAASYQTRSNFIRMALVEHFGAESQYELTARSAPHMQNDKKLFNMYDFKQQYEDYKNEVESEGKAI